MSLTVIIHIERGWKMVKLKK